MRQGKSVGVVIPALNEERAIAKVIGEIPAWVDQIVVVDNGSDDATPERARAAGATVVHEPQRGYGAACLRGIATLDDVSIVVFLDGDHSDQPAQMAQLVDPIAAGECQFVLGARRGDGVHAGALTPQQRFGNWLACRLMRLLWRTEYTDLGPFRAISSDALKSLAMADRNYGWTIEMQIKAVLAGLATREVAVGYRQRIGTSKISGTLKGTVMAGIKIIWTIARFAFAYGPRFTRPVRARPNQ